MDEEQKYLDELKIIDSLDYDDMKKIKLLYEIEFLKVKIEKENGTMLPYYSITNGYDVDE